MTEPIASSTDTVRHAEVVDPYDFDGPLFATALFLEGHYAYAGLATGISLLIGLMTARQIRISTARDGRTYLVVQPLWRRRTADKAVELIGMKLEHWRFGVCSGLELTSSNLCLSVARRGLHKVGRYRSVRATTRGWRWEWRPRAVALNAANLLLLAIGLVILRNSTGWMTALVSILIGLAALSSITGACCGSPRLDLRTEVLHEPPGSSASR